MRKIDKLLSLPQIEVCKCSYCSKLTKPYIYRFSNTKVHFYCWENQFGDLITIYLVDCPYKSDFDMFEEIELEKVFELLDDDGRITIIFNLELFGKRPIL